MEVDPTEVVAGQVETLAPADKSAAVLMDGEEGNGEARGGVPEHASESSSDSDSDEDDAAVKREMEALEFSLREQPLDYDSHVKYIKLLRKSGEIEKLREAREVMNKYFPLAPQMWQEWATDEISLSKCKFPAEIEKIYERGVQEYLSIPLWRDYLNYVQEHNPSVLQCSPAGVSKMRDLFERALTAGGLHVLEGNVLWESYRDFEQALLIVISDADDEETAKQTNRIRALFQRQLSVPLVNLQLTFDDYKVWESEHRNEKEVSFDLGGVPGNVLSSYQKAVSMYNARQQYEDLVANPDAFETENFQKFVDYIKFEESHGDPARVQILYERAVAQYPVSGDLWLGYAGFIDGTLKVPGIIRSVYCRATRNCTWLGELWVRYLLALERLCASEDELREVFERSLQCPFSSVKEYLDLFLTRVDGLRRRITSSGTDNNDINFELIRETFMNATNLLSSQLSDEDSLHLHSYWARLEANLGNDSAASRGVWESLLKKSGSILDVWKSYIAMEIETGHMTEARSVYKRCYNKRFPESGSEEICHSWLRFECEYGTLQDYDLAVKKVTPRLKELAVFNAQQELKNNENVASNSHLKRKPSQLPSQKQPPVKKNKDTSNNTVESAAHVATNKSNYGSTAGENQVTSASPTKVDVSASSKQASEIKASKETKDNRYNDHCTAFISNISLEANEEDIRKFFGDSGGVVAVRLLKDKFTKKSRGLAYVDFSDNEHLTTAVTKNKQKLRGKKLSIARSDPKQSRKNVNAGTTAPASTKAPFRGDVEGNKQSVDDKMHEVRLFGKNTFAAPRNLAKPLGWTAKKGDNMEGSSEELKSNEEFRNLFLKK